MTPVIWFLLDSLWRNHWALSNQQKVRLEISEIPRAQWNGTFQVAHRRDRPKPPCVLICVQEREKGYWGQQCCQMDRDISVGPGPLKVVHDRGLKYSGRIEPKCPVPTEIFGILGWMESAHSFHFYWIVSLVLIIDYDYNSFNKARDPRK